MTRPMLDRSTRILAMLTLATVGCWEQNPAFLGDSTTVGQTSLETTSSTGPVEPDTGVTTSSTGVAASKRSLVRSGSPKM